MKDNPEFKGEWYAKRVSNPAYKGFWEAKKIANPEYEEDDTVYSYPDFGFIGFDLWQVKSGSIFDNIIITDDVAEADKFSAKWKALNEKEKEEQKNGGYAGQPKGHAGDVHSHIGRDVKTRLDSETIVRFHNEG
jgi:calreticulin